MRGLGGRNRLFSNRIWPCRASVRCAWRMAQSLLSSRPDARPL